MAAQAVRSRPLTRIVVGSIQRRVSLGGWSDWARIGSVEAANDLAKLVGKLVLYTFADGVDLDFEHLSPFVNAFPGDNEIGYLAPPPFAKNAEPTHSSVACGAHAANTSNVCGSTRLSLSSSAHRTFIFARNVHSHLCVYKYTLPQVILFTLFQ